MMHCDALWCIVMHCNVETIIECHRKDYKAMSMIITWLYNDYKHIKKIIVDQWITVSWTSMIANVNARPREGTKAGASSKVSSDPRPKALENRCAMTNLWQIYDTTDSTMMYYDSTMTVLWCTMMYYESPKSSESSESGHIWKLWLEMAPKAPSIDSTCCKACCTPGEPKRSPTNLCPAEYEV